jgi:vesicle-fusing ATPase
MQRQWIGLAVAGDTIPIEPCPTQPNYLQSLDLDVGFLRKTDSKEAYSADELARNFLKAFTGIVVAVGEYMIFDYHGQNLKVLVKSLSVLELSEQQRGGGGGRRSEYGPDPRSFGILMDKTDITMMKASDGNGINIKSSAKK